MNISSSALDAAHDIENAYREDAMQDPAFIARRIQAAIDAEIARQAPPPPARTDAVPTQPPFPP